MKKIVALALALVLALSLATVAFAGSTAEVGQVYEVLDGKVTDNKWSCKMTYKAAKDVVLQADGKAWKTLGNVAYYVADTNDSTWVVCDADKAGAALYTASGWVYLKVAERVQYELKATKLAKSDCVNDGAQLYSFVKYDDGKTYYAGAGSTYVALVDGEVVLLDAGSKTLTATHEWEAATYEKDGITAATYKCANCAVTAKVVTNAEALAADKTLLSVGPKGEKLIMSAAAGASAAATTTSGVSSAKTFDAGVALYAGMALMSVAGSAVVIGKKKEF